MLASYTPDLTPLALAPHHDRLPLVAEPEAASRTDMQLAALPNAAALCISSEDRGESFAPLQVARAFLVALDGDRIDLLDLDLAGKRRTPPPPSAKPQVRSYKGSGGCLRAAPRIP
jgi:hypothetical protein